MDSKEDIKIGSKVRYTGSEPNISAFSEREVLKKEGSFCKVSGISFAVHVDNLAGGEFKVLDNDLRAEVAEYIESISAEIEEIMDLTIGNNLNLDFEPIYKAIQDLKLKIAS